jgi:hypothetical protein
MKPPRFTIRRAGRLYAIDDRKTKTSVPYRSLRKALRALMKQSPHAPLQASHRN